MTRYILLLLHVQLKCLCQNSGVYPPPHILSESFLWPPMNLLKVYLNTNIGWSTILTFSVIRCICASVHLHISLHGQLCSTCNTCVVVQVYYICRNTCVLHVFSDTCIIRMLYTCNTCVKYAARNKQMCHVCITCVIYM